MTEIRKESVGSHSVSTMHVPAYAWIGLFLTTMVASCNLTAFYDSENDRNLQLEALKHGYHQEVDRGNPSTRYDDKVIWVKDENDSDHN